MKHASAIEAYRWLLRLYPPVFRREFGEEMEAVFSASLAEAAHRGSWALLRCVAREAAHAPALLLQAHLDERRAAVTANTAPGANWQESGMTRREYIIMYGLAALPLATLGWWFGIMQGRAAFSLTTAAWVVAGILVVPALAWATQRLSPWLWAAGGLAALGALAVPALRPAMYGQPTPDGRGLVPGPLWWLPSTALVVAAMLVAAVCAPPRASGCAACSWRWLGCCWQQRCMRCIGSLYGTRRWTRPIGWCCCPCWPPSSQGWWCWQRCRAGRGRSRHNCA